jgi:hypothetical protein
VGIPRGRKVVIPLLKFSTNSQNKRNAVGIRGRTHCGGTKTRRRVKQMNEMTERKIDIVRQQPRVLDVL